MKQWTWLIIAVLAWALMFESYEQLFRGEQEAPWALGFLCIGKGKPAEPLEVGTHFSTRARLLPAGRLAQSILDHLGNAKPERKAALQAELLPKLIELPVREMGLLIGWLAQGRLPEPGENEVLAGSQCAQGDLSVDGATLKVVGRLQPSVALFVSSYLAPAHQELDSLFDSKDRDVCSMEVVEIRPGTAPIRESVERLQKVFPSGSFAIVGAQVRPEPRAFLAYLVGQALFLLAGSSLFIGLYRWTADRCSWPVLAAPLQELARRPRLLWSVHLAYFGLFVLCALIIYQLPDLHTFLMSAVQGEIRSEGNGVLAIAGRAYGTGNVFYAAAVTFLVNFFLGSLAFISLPSLIIPGIGGLLAAFRAMLWGMLLGPSESSLAFMMLPHTGTLLLEGEGYILAAFFALLVPVYLFGSGLPAQKPVSADEWSPEPGAFLAPARLGFWSRYAGAWTMCLKANVLVAIVLAVAACYEAVEVIMMARL